VIAYNAAAAETLSVTTNWGTAAVSLICLPQNISFRAIVRSESAQAVVMTRLKSALVRDTANATTRQANVHVRKVSKETIVASETLLHLL